jgi:predicted Zn-dependent protease
MTLPMAAAMVASVALAASNPKAGSAALAASQAASAQRQVNYTRAHEQEADRIGARILSKAGFNPNGMSDFFKRLDRMPGGLSAQIPEFLRTHPLPSSRMADNVGRFSEKNARPNKRDDASYHLAKARIRVLTSGNTGGLIRNYETSLSKGGYKNERAERYGYALALKQAGRYEEAQQQITRLRKIDPDRLAFRIEEAEIALARGDRARAWRLFEDARKLYTNDFTLAMHYGQALAARGDPRQAMRILQPHLQRRKDVPALHTVYAQAAQRTGEMGAAYGAMAEHYRINGKLPEAIQQLETGLNAPGTTPYQQAQLRARLRQLQQEEEMAKRHQQ